MKNKDILIVELIRIIEIIQVENSFYTNLIRIYRNAKRNMNENIEYLCCKFYKVTVLHH